MSRAPRLIQTALKTIPMGCTLKEVGERAGVSVRTASYILNGHGDRLFRADTAERVRRAALAMGYRPNRSAQAIRAGRFNAIGLALSTLAGRSNLPDALLAGIHDSLTAQEMNLTVARLPDAKLKDDRFIPQLLRSWMVDGLLINYTDHIPTQLITLLDAHQVPSVWINTKRKTDCVRPDDMEAGRRATVHLLRMGHQRIAYADFSHGESMAESHYSAIDRCDGYRRAMEAAGFQPMTMLAEPAESPDHRIRRLIATLNQADRPTAFITYSRKVAESCYVAAIGVNLRVPEDLSLICFDEHSRAHLAIEMATMVVPSREVGLQAVAMLLQKIEHPRVAQPARVVAFDFDQGRSCAPPSAAARSAARQ